MHIFDTIAAVSTPRGKGGIAVLRVSGADAREILNKVFRPFKGSGEYRPRYATYGEIIAADGSVMDEGLVTYFPASAGLAPASSTRASTCSVSRAPP